MLLFFIVLGTASSCGPVTPFEETVDELVLASVDTLVVPPSAPRDSIPTRIAGVIGTTSAFSFDFVHHTRSDTLFRVTVWGRFKFRSGDVPQLKQVAFDTTIVLRSPAAGKHFIELRGANRILRDSTVVY
jgi:hypothetical protein